MHGAQKMVVPESRFPQCKQFSNLAITFAPLYSSMISYSKTYTALSTSLQTSIPTFHAVRRTIRLYEKKNRRSKKTRPISCDQHFRPPWHVSCSNFKRHGPLENLLIRKGQIGSPGEPNSFSRSSKMNWDTMKGQWKQLQGKVKEKWGKLTDDDLTTINGQKDQFIGKIQERYGYAKDQATREVDEFCSSCNCDTATAHRV
jgi:uncharacterized protein YjbJ (UPF0337 family)